MECTLFPNCLLPATKFTRPETPIILSTLSLSLS
uniref:Uncharacterized protein n=1 Tax=Anopheles quadriannulatus TaxID=34691 RepID=A0A182XTE0_ANOQN